MLDIFFGYQVLLVVMGAFFIYIDQYSTTKIGKAVILKLKKAIAASQYTVEILSLLKV